MIKSINAILLHTRNVEQLAAFYRDIVGLDMKLENHGNGLHAETDIGNFHFAIFPGDQAPTVKGPVTVSVQVDNVEKEYLRIKALGHEQITPPQAMPFGGILSELRDPDGNGICLMQWQSELVPDKL